MNAHIIVLAINKEGCDNNILFIATRHATSKPNIITALGTLLITIIRFVRLSFFQAIKAAMAKATTTTGKTAEELDSAIKQIVSKAVSSNEIIDIFQAAGVKTPEVSVLSEDFLEEVRGMKHKNLAFEALKKLLNDQVKSIFKRKRRQA